jgi:hypothetical protein
MSSVGVITFHFSSNYGAILQAYALQEVLKDMGYVAELIDYRDDGFQMVSFSRLRKVRHFVWHKVVKRALVGTERQRKTELFREKYLRLSAREYHSSETLCFDPPQYDVYITGSDQVWNPRIHNNDSSYFLTFVPEGKKRISYAASFGVTRIPEKLISKCAKWLKEIDHISTREFEGKQLIEQLTGRNAVITLDPTLLLDDEQWRQIAIPYKHPREYILCYHMPGDKEVTKCIDRIARRISALTGWDVINIGQKAYMRLDPRRYSVFDAGPAEFVGLIENASFVVTNSFHGTAFSINYKKPFLAPINPALSPERALSSRITSLLQIVELEARLVPVGKPIAGSLYDILHLDYEPVERLLQRERRKSLEFLEEALGGS